LLAAWFHDTGYDKGAVNHEERSAMYARDYLSSQGYNPDNLRRIEGCILATKMPHTPKDLLERVICDADLGHIGQKVYWERCSKVRQEMALTRDIIMTDQEWVDFELEFMKKHHFHTPVAQELYIQRKQKHIRQLEKQKVRLNPHAAYTVDSISTIPNQKKKKKKKKELKENNLGRGVESTRPKITEGKFTVEDIKAKRSNLLFFGNFYNMKMDDFHWGMMEMIKDPEFLYSSMTRDLDYLGVVLAKKYRYLRICYGIFMYGLIVAVLTFAVAFML